MVPSLVRGNPYLRLLAETLESCGVQVDLVNGPSLPGLEAGEPPDVVHLHWQHRFFLAPRGGILRNTKRARRFFSDLSRLRRRGVAVVWTVHNIVNHERVSVRWELACCRRLARKVDAIVVHCEEAARTVRSRYGASRTPIVTIPHGSYVGVYPDGPSREEARRELGIDTGSKVVLFFGQLRAYKGIGGLLESFRDVTVEGALLRVIGQAHNPQLLETLRRAAAVDPRVVVFPEFAEDVRLSKELAACDVVALPYADSLTSGSAVLAASVGRAAVMPALGCMREFPLEAAFLYDPTVPNALREALVEAVTGCGHERGEAAREFVTGWDWASVGRRTLEVYQRALA